MPLHHIILLATLPLLLAASAACSASETALFSLSHADRLRLRKSNPKLHGTVATLLHSPRSLLVTILLSNVAVNTAYLVVTSLVASTLSPVWAAVAGAGGVLTVLLMGEIVPKSIAAVHRVPMVRVVAPMMVVWHRVMSPVRRFFEEYVIAPIVRVLRPVRSAGADLTTDDLSALLELGARQGVFEAAEQHLLDDVVRLSEVRVKECMTPRVHVRWLDAGDTTDRLLDLVRSGGGAKFPVCRGEFEPGRVVGFASVQRALPVLARLGSTARAPLGPLVEPPRFVPESARLDQLLDHFRQTRSDLALCVNEQGDITGIIAMDDVIRHLVAASAGPHSEPHEQVRLKGPGVWEVSGRLAVREWEEFFGSDEAAPARVTTVAGLMAVRLGRVPRVGDQITVRNMRLRVEQVSGRQVERVSVRLEPVEAPA